MIYNNIDKVYFGFNFYLQLILQIKQLNFEEGLKQHRNHKLITNKEFGLLG